ncbi:MAG: hybrid sensor histidine kinase/response regulator [Chloroflexota bacterium]|nr:MAG: hybrid sensor histidine kinase/response regulator [Chloroflexota bacterium]
MRILIAEDTPVERLLLQRAVEGLGHDCVVAADGAEAWALFEAEDVDVIISDWLMPKMDGPELCRRVRAQRGAFYTYFLILTALTDKQHALAGMQVGADDYLMKPLDVDDLAARLIAAERVTTVQRQLVAAERAKDEMVSVVSHELRTPLSSIVGFAELLQTREYGEAEQREFLAIIVDESNRLSALINDFLDMQRIESGREFVRPVPTEVLPLLQRAAAAAGDDPQRPILVETPGTLPLVLADLDRVQQVLANLLSNARKYSPSGGEVRLSARLVDGTVELSVTDHGLGIPPEALPRLFGKFYRVDNADRREIKGTGLGLAICQKLVAAHGGRIWVESGGQPQGSCFRFTLPLVGHGPARADVLIVEDDPAFARLMDAELAAVGLTTVRAPSAEAALAWVAAAAPRAVVLDLLLPGLQGEDFLPRLREIMDGPVVVVTVKHVLADDADALARQGVVAVLRKGPGAAVRAAEAVRAALAPADVAAERGDDTRAAT